MKKQSKRPTSHILRRIETRRSIEILTRLRGGGQPLAARPDGSGGNE